MNSSITIKHIDAADVGAFRQVRLEALRSDPSFYASSYEDWVALSKDEWLQRLSNPVFIALADDEPVGITGLIPQRASNMAHRASIVMVYVHKNQRGTGLAARLLKAAADHARETGIIQLELAVSAENVAAIAFYRKEGFVEVGRIPGGFRHEGREIDDVIMVRRLAEPESI